MECKSCGAHNDDNTTFCSSCGFNLRLGASPTESAPPVASPAESTPVPISTVLRNAGALIIGPTDFLTKNKDLVLPLRSVIVNYLLILALIPFIAGIIGDTAFGGGPPVVGLTVAYSLEVYFLDVVAVITIGAVVWKLAPFFGAETDQPKATLLTVYAATPFFVLSVLYVVPYVGVISYVGLLYGLYILFRGLPILLSARPKRAVVFVLVIFGVSVVVLGVLAVMQYVIAVALGSVLG